MSANIYTGGVVGAAPTSFRGLWGVGLPGVTYEPFMDADEYRNRVLQDNPVAFWMLDDISGSTADDAMNAVDLTYNNSPNLYTLGPSFNLPRAVQMNGSDENATSANSATFTRAASENWSLECWLQYTSTSNSLAAVYVRNTDALFNTVTGGIICNNTTAGVISAQTPSAAGSIQINSGSGFNDGQWHHVVVTSASGGNLTLYVDGTSVASSGTSRNTTSSQRSITVGSNRTGVSSYIQYWPGSLAAVAYYNTTLSSTQVTAHWNAGKT